MNNFFNVFLFLHKNAFLFCILGVDVFVYIYGKNGLGLHG